MVSCSSQKQADFESMPMGSDAILTEDDAILLLIDHFGLSDKDTGNAYSFSILDSVTVDGIDYYHGRWSRLVKNEDGEILHSSLLTEFFLTKDGKLFYEGTYDYESNTAQLSEPPIHLSES